MSKVLFIGCGNMGNAIIGGILKERLLSPENLNFYEINPELKQKMRELHSIEPIDSIDESVKEYSCIILAVKPQVFNNFEHDNVMRHLGAYVSQEQVVVSIMAGIPISRLARFFINNPELVRVMPNTPALVGESMSVLSPGEKVSEKNLSFVTELFKSIGKVEILAESYLDAVTGLSGSGPAYVFTFIEALISGGVLNGLPKKIAHTLAVQTVAGAVKMIEESGETLEELRHMVTSPGGTTIEALHSLEKDGFRAAVAQAVRAAGEKSKALGKKN